MAPQTPGATPSPGTGSRSLLARIFKPDRPWRRIGEVSAAGSLILGLLTIYLATRPDASAENVLPKGRAPLPVERGVNDLAVYLDCVPAGCKSPSRDLKVEATVAGLVPSGHEIVLLIRDDGQRRWTLRSPIVAGADRRWSGSVRIGGRGAPEGDKTFRLCAILLPSSRVDELSEQQSRSERRNLAEDALPREGRQLTCIPATRLAKN